MGPLPKLNISGHLLGVQLMSTSAYVHTSLLYGQWEGWNGKPLDEPPLFYNGLTASTANLLSSISDEIVNIGNAVELNSEADMSNVREPIFSLVIVLTKAAPRFFDNVECRTFSEVKLSVQEIYYFCFCNGF